MAVADENLPVLDERPCPCFLYEDNGEAQEQCECGDMLEEHADRGGAPKQCLARHAEDCPGDHGDEPCPAA